MGMDDGEQESGRGAGGVLEGDAGGPSLKEPNVSRCPLVLFCIRSALKRFGLLEIGFSSWFVGRIGRRLVAVRGLGFDGMLASGFGYHGLCLRGCRAVLFMAAAPQHIPS